MADAILVCSFQPGGREEGSSQELIAKEVDELLANLEQGVPCSAQTGHSSFLHLLGASIEKFHHHRPPKTKQVENWPFCRKAAGPVGL